MKTFLTFVLGVFLLIGTSSCSQKHIDYSIDLAMINSDYNLMVERFDTLRTLTLSKWELFSDEEKIKLGMINDNVERIIHKVDLLRSTSFYKVPPADMGYIYTLGVQSYEMSREIYLNHESQLSGTEILSFKLFDSRLKDLDEQMQELISNPENTDINFTLISILTVVSSGLKLLLPLVL